MVGSHSDDILDLIRDRIFRIEAKWHGGGHSGTAFVVAKQHRINRLILATAKHVLNVPEDRPVTWLYQGFATDNTVNRQAMDVSDARSARGVPYRTSNLDDVGIIQPPVEASDGKPLSPANEMALPTIPPELLQSEGARVGWAGFPGEVEDYLKRPQLCYYEGVVSACVNTVERSVYLVDGHMTNGVSGGPLWHWSKDRQRLEILGVAASYGLYTPILPGLCVFEPINKVTQFLVAWNKERESFMHEPQTPEPSSITPPPP